MSYIQTRARSHSLWTFHLRFFRNAFFLLVLLLLYRVGFAFVFWFFLFAIKWRRYTKSRYAHASYRRTHTPVKQSENCVRCLLSAEFARDCALFKFICILPLVSLFISASADSTHSDNYMILPNRKLLSQREDKCFTFICGLIPAANAVQWIWLFAWTKMRSHDVCVCGRNIIEMTHERLYIAYGC